MKTGKYIIYITMVATMLLSGTLLHGEDIKGVGVSNVKVYGTDGKVTVSFTLRVDDRAVKSSRRMVLAPVITNGEYKTSFQPVVIEGRRSAIANERYAMAELDRTGASLYAFYTTNGKTFRYHTTGNYQHWMEGADLTLEAVTGGCCSMTPLADEVIASNLSVDPGYRHKTIMVTEQYVDYEVVERPHLVMSTADKLAVEFPFVTPSARLVKAGEEIVFDEDRDNSLTVYYHVSKSNIDRDLGDNRKSLDDLKLVIGMLERAPDSEIMAIVIAGFASPEGPHEFNEKLAWNRGLAVKNEIMTYTRLDADQIKVYSGAEDWHGLRLMVEASDMPWRERVLDIIDNTPVWDAKKQTGRLGQLQRLDNGEPYRYMLRNWFPKLRNAAYIKIYYNNLDEE